MPPIEWNLTTGLLLAAGWYVLTSIASFLLYGWDKLLARFSGLSSRVGGRIPESVLHEVDLLGGWPGGLAGRSTWRHKTHKASFVRTFRWTVAGNLTVASAATGIAAFAAWGWQVKIGACVAVAMVVRFVVGWIRIRSRRAA
ncbi:MAG: DUF1294 domain-containing protein [Phycisphaerales bacterium]